MEGPASRGSRFVVAMTESDMWGKRLIRPDVSRSSIATATSLH